MIVKMGLCQLVPEPGNPAANAEAVCELLATMDADVLAFPEMFLTGYGSDISGLKDDTEAALDKILAACKSADKAVAIGAPRWDGGRIYNGYFFLSPDGVACYDKAHLAKFGIYSEDGFDGGNHRVMGTYKGILFGMCVCYDIFFPEILHGCSLNGASVNICCAASAKPSKPFLDAVLPARAVENVTYMVYINNVGPMAGLDMHGCSRGLDPLGNTIADCGDDVCVSIMWIDTDHIRKCRDIRRHLEDFRSDVDWLGEPRSSYCAKSINATISSSHRSRGGPAR